MKRVAEDVPTHQLTVNLEYDDSKYSYVRINGIAVFNENGEYKPTEYKPSRAKPSSLIFVVEESTYDIIIEFYKKNGFNEFELTLKLEI